MILFVVYGIFHLINIPFKIIYKYEIRFHNLELLHLI